MSEQSIWRVRESLRMKGRRLPGHYLLILQGIPRKRLLRWRYRHMEVKVIVRENKDGQKRYATYSTGADSRRVSVPTVKESYFTYLEACFLADHLNVEQFGRCE